MGWDRSRAEERVRVKPTTTPPPTPPPPPAPEGKKLGATAERTRVNFQMTAPAGRRSSTDKAARSTGTRSLNSTAKGASTASVPGYEWSPEDAAAAVEHTNPFAMPREDDIFAVRDRERAAKKAVSIFWGRGNVCGSPHLGAAVFQEREHINRMRVHEKAAYHAQKTYVVCGFGWECARSLNSLSFFFDNPKPAPARQSQRRRPRR